MQGDGHNWEGPEDRGDEALKRFHAAQWDAELQRRDAERDRRRRDRDDQDERAWAEVEQRRRAKDARRRELSRRREPLEPSPSPPPSPVDLAGVDVAELRIVPGWVWLGED